MTYETRPVLARSSSMWDKLDPAPTVPVVNGPFNLCSSSGACGKIAAVDLVRHSIVRPKDPISSSHICHVEFAAPIDVKELCRVCHTGSGHAVNHFTGSPGKIIVPGDRACMSEVGRKQMIESMSLLRVRTLNNGAAATVGALRRKAAVRARRPRSRPLFSAASDAAASVC